MTIHLDGKLGRIAILSTLRPRLGAETRYSSSAERTSSMWLTPSAVASS